MRQAFSVAVFARPTHGPHQGRVLLIHHKRLDTWLPVGGEIEEGETPLQAAQRELFEETGLRGTFTPMSDLDGEPPGLLAYEEHDAGSKGRHLNFCFLADVDSDVIANNGEFHAHRFVDDSFDLPCPTNVRQLVARAVVGGRPALVSIARRWLAHFNARELDALLALYADDAVHVSPKLRDRRPETHGEIRGKDALRAWWADAFARLPDLRYDERAVTAERDRVFLEYVRRVPGEPDLVVAELYDVRDGRIVSSHVFHG